MEPDVRRRPSDVLFCAALGYAAGLAVMGESIPWRGIGDRMTLSGEGIGLRVRF